MNTGLHLTCAFFFIRLRSAAELPTLRFPFPAASLAARFAASFSNRLEADLFVLLFAAELPPAAASLAARFAASFSRRLDADLLIFLGFPSEVRAWHK